MAGVLVGVHSKRVFMADVLVGVHCKRKSCDGWGPRSCPQ